MNPASNRVASNVRRLRESHLMSLAQLAARSGISKSTLSQIETSSANPTLSTLGSLAEALSVDLKDLLAPGAGDAVVVVVRAGEGADVSGPASLGRLSQSTLVGPSVLEFYQLELEPGGVETSASHGVGSREHILVVDGMVQLGPEASPVLAHAGDYVAFSADQVHRWENPGVNTARYWIVSVRPRGLVAPGD